MTGLSGPHNPNNPFKYNTYSHLWAPELCNLLSEGHTRPDWDEYAPRSRQTSKRSKKPKKRHSKPAKKPREHLTQGYILQAIGILCLVLAAVKSFEPLMGVGFTLVLLGHNRNAKRNVRIDLPPAKQEYKSSSARKKPREATCPDDVEQDLMIVKDSNKRSNIGRKRRN